MIATKTFLLVLISSFLSLAFILFLGYFCWVFYLQKCENKLLIQFNHLKNKQAIKREKYINLIEIADPSLKLIATYLKDLITNFETKLEVTEKNLLLLRKIKHQGNYSDYWAKVKKIKTDIQVLTTTINNIDQHAINSKAFKNNTLSLLIKIRAVFVELENFYLNNLLTREFFNQDFFNCIHEIKQQLIAINYYIGSVNQEKLLTEFQQLISNLKLLYNWIFHVYLGFQKIEQVAKIYSLAQKIRNEDNLFFSFETKDKLNLVGQKLENQLVVAQEYLRLGQFQQGEPIIKELLTNGFEFHATIILAQKEQKMLNDPFLVDTIFGKTKFFVVEYKKWFQPIIDNWITNFNNNSVQLQQQALAIAQKSWQLEVQQREYFNLQRKQENLNSKELLVQAYQVSSQLADLIGSIGNLNQVVIQANEKSNELISQFLKLNIELPQLIEQGQKVCLPDEEICQKLLVIKEKINQLVEKSSQGYDILLTLESEFWPLLDQYEIYKIQIEHLFHVRLLFQKLHQKWLALAIFHQQPYEQINAMIKIKIKEKAWFECLTICLNQMNELQQIINHQNKKPGFFQGLISGWNNKKVKI